ncbi:fimbria/pilus periplasmic chaperone (plasmid) [Vibrio cyclitrophicus]|uniref:fimbria/pilus periplasmic chaperone n=1 Tax=Vibrio cyclitrophicus TaxID=47951 RepID=UPI000C824847|nr:fimbria/pilus periplasmic chaperone [Vibrio cyclitrophicus]PMJ44437.1 Clp protease ClpE [Vibrio cyclitrophicus]
MTIKRTLTLAFLLPLLGVTQAFAALELDATRYIYDGDSQSISAMASNGSNKEFGAQVWVDNIVEDDTRPTFIATPSFFKIKAEGRQVFRMMKVSDHMPTDKESIYWLNLQEIPPAQQGSGIAMAVRTKVKLLYRPEGLSEGRDGAEKQLSVEHLPGEQWLVNNTPYIFTIGTVRDSKDSAITLSAEDVDELKMFEPGDRVKLPQGVSVSAVDALNDYGNMETYELDK